LKGGLNEDQAWSNCQQERQWELEALEIEREVCKRQAEILFNIEKADTLKDIVEPPSSLADSQSMIDPRVVEHEVRRIREHLDSLIQQRTKDPTRPKNTLQEAGVSETLVADYISKNPATQEFFDESVYFGGEMYHHLPKRLRRSDILNKVLADEEMDDSDEEEEKSVIKSDDDDEQVEVEEEEEEEEKEEVEKESRLLEDMDLQVRDWAKHLIDTYFMDKVDPNLAETPRDRHILKYKADETIATREEQQEILDNITTQTYEDFNQSGEYHKLVAVPMSGAEEVITTKEKENPYTQRGLEEELNALFKDLYNHKK